MIASNCKRMSRLKIAYTVVYNAIKLINRLGARELIPKEMEHYLDTNDYNQVIYYSKSEEVENRLNKVLKDAVKLSEIMSEDSWFDFSEYKLLIRVISEQTEVGSDNSRNPKSKN